MSNIQIINGNCLDVLPTFEPNYIDSVVTDPPYGLKFMGQDWDHGVPGVHFWQEILRVAKPGAYLLAFGGTRTYHRLVCAIEDAGWEIRDMIEWIYGCLSEDTEILTINGWERYHKNIEDYPVLCYNIDKDSFAFYKPTRSFIYENKHTAYRIQSDNTDQLVSRNHRVIVERSGRKIFAYAEALEREEDIPFLESLCDLPETIPNIYEGTSITKQDLLKRVQQQNNFIRKEKDNSQADVGTKNNINNMSSMRKTNMETKFMVEEKQTSVLQHIMQGKACVSSNINSKQVRQNRAEISRIWFKRCKQSSLEGWNNLFQNAWKLCWSKVCSLSRRIFTDGSQGWLCYGAPINNGTIIKPMFTENRSSTPYQSQPTRQSFRKSTTFSIKQGTQITRSTVTPIEYNGKVWCVEVPTGAFVARRNGKIFITGNSGFPKSLNIGKAVDKLQGNEREVVGKQKGAGTTGDNQVGNQTFVAKNQYEDGTHDITKGNSEWEGWGTALKPAHEPIVLARKPIDGTVAANVLMYKTGGLNIDGCRVETEEKITNHSRGSESAKSKGKYGNSKEQETHQTIGQGLGRFPANLIHDGSEEVLAVFPETKSGKDRNPAKTSNSGFTGHGIRTEEVNYGDSGSAARFFYCAKASKWDRDEGLEDCELKPLTYANQALAEVKRGNLEHYGSTGLNTVKMRTNNHPTVKPTSLMRYLCRLITPPNGLILDPFCGSGSTGKAAILEGFRFVGIDKEKEYCEIAEKRIEAIYRFNRHKQQTVLELR